MLIEILEKVPTEAWVTLFGVILGSLLTTLGVWLTNKSNERQAVLRMKHESELSRGVVRKERLEELFSLVFEWESLLRDEYAFYDVRLMQKGALLGFSALDRPVQISEDAFTRINMISTIYGDGVLQYYNSASDAVLALRRIWHSYDMAEEKHAVSSYLLKLADEANQVRYRVFADFKQAIIFAARAT
ncbi:hypothetical protein [Pseudomonas protegens]|uniref:hypothetical protein n=1 Tax=Pseudomonas protegens TaxID=380021 RepID=UPI00384F1AC9